MRKPHAQGACDHPDCWPCGLCGQFWSHAMTADVMGEHEFYDCPSVPLSVRNERRLADGLEAIPE